MTSSIVLRVFCLLMLLTCIRAAYKPFTCMSYMEDEKSTETDDDFDDYALMASTYQSVEKVLPAEPTAAAKPHRRICQSDYTYCFSLWRQTPSGTHIEKQGCWKESTERNATCSQLECNSSAPTSNNDSLYYCCCSGDACNQKMAVVEPAPLQFSHDAVNKASNLTNIKQHANNSVWSTVLLWCLLFIIGIVASFFLVYYFCHSTAEKPVPEEAPLAPSGPGYSSNLRNVDNINLICMLGSGKYGTVMKGLLHDQEVAVKIFPESHHQYYINERNIYSLPLMDSSSLLTYFGYDERHTMEGKVEYQLVLSLAPLGCLQDWLIANTMDFDTFCGMAKTITRGLSHLHTELRRGDDHKPCIAHRDLNSRNVLVKADRTCCIADFGFALKVFGSKYEYKGEVAMAETKSINEVGTLRYMAPELLEGAVNLRDCETSLKQMDVYSLGLVLWEVATRCTDFYAPAQALPSYKMPYELEVGAHPTFDQMKKLVVRLKARPLFPAGLGGGAAGKLVKDTCEDCWDHDAEARLTSLCAEERMQEVSGLRPRLHHPQSASPVLNANNLVGTHTDPNHPNARNLTAETVNSSQAETAAILHPPPNRQVLSRTELRPQTEKNHLMYPQQLLQPYQGRNPCQERNLAPITTRAPQVLVEKSKKHSFQSGQENSFSCLEDDVSVEELISGGRLKKFPSLPHDALSNMGQGFPKQHNTDKKLRGWHGVRALIQKKLFRNDGNTDVFRQLGAYGGGDEKSNLVEKPRGLDNRSLQSPLQLPPPPPLPLEKTVTVSFIDDKERNSNEVATARTTATSVDNVCHPHNRRPKNLDLSAMTNVRVFGGVECHKSNLLHSSITEASNGRANVNISVNINDNDSLRGKQLNTRISTPSHVVPRSLSSNLIKTMNNNNNNNLCEAELKTITSTTSADTNSNSNSADGHFRRQRSLEVFREVFSGRGSTEKLRDPSQRVKTPGDVPPSVRKVRASKTLSLYDDRMMDSSTLNIL